MTLSFAPERIEQWPLARLQPSARNAKAHGADQVAKIAASMAEFGWTVPCLVAEDGELIAGHGRVLAATQLGLTNAPVIVLGHLTEAQRRAYRIADNKLTELGTWDEALLSAELNDLLAEDFDLSLVGFSDGELDKLLAFVPEEDGQEGGAGGSVAPVTIPEPPRNPASRTGDLWIRATSGRMSPASSARSSRPSCSSRMSPIISASASPKSPADWSAWATSLRQASSQRRKSARPTSANGSSSSPSAKTTSWPTPRACSGTRSSGGNRTELLRLWPTPRASANENRQTKPTPSQEAGQHGMNLATTAALWPTPQIDSFRSRGGERKEEKGLDRMARDWPTPMANDGCKPSAGNRRTADLTHAAGMWMTPTARDHKDGATTLANTPVNGLLGRQVLVTPMPGSDTSDARRTLNPLFGEALMGWPTGWTGFGSVATAWSLWLQRMRCELWRLNCWPTIEVAG